MTVLGSAHKALAVSGSMSNFVEIEYRGGSLAGWRPANRAWTGWASTSPRETFWWAAHLAWQRRGPKYKEMQRRRRGTDRAPLSMRSESCADRSVACDAAYESSGFGTSKRALPELADDRGALAQGCPVGLQVPSALFEQEGGTTMRRTNLASIHRIHIRLICLGHMPNLLI